MKKAVLKKQINLSEFTILKEKELNKVRGGRGIMDTHSDTVISVIRKIG